MRLTIAVFAALFTLAPAASAKNAVDVAADVKAITAAMDKSADDWNRGDIEAFATSYKNSPDILFIGKTISHGYADMVATYHQHYPTRAKMGKLSFSNFKVQMLDAKFATATGNYHLDLPASEGSTADGYYLLVLEKTADGWKIIRDDTTSLPKTTKP